MGRHYLRVANELVSSIWLITQDGMKLITDIAEARIGGTKLSDEEITILLEQAGAHGADVEGAQVQDGIGVLPIYGPIFGKANLMTELSGATSMETFRKDFKQMLADPSVKAILLDIDSPGGTSSMIAEAGAEIFAARDVKPVYALANEMAGSAALWLASQASKFYSAPSGSVGSLGAFTVHEDQSAYDAQQGRRFTFISAGPYKTEGNPHQPLSQEGQAYRQEVINELYDQFTTAVATGRNKSVDEVVANFGGGRMLMPKKALEVGMIDGIVEFDSLVEQISSEVTPPQRVQVMLDGKTYASALLSGGELHLEAAEWEHSEPGTGNPPAPRLPDHTERDIASGSRRGDLPPGFPNESNEPGAPKASVNNGGNMNEEQLKQLMLLFNVDSEEALVAAITDLHAQNAELDNAIGLAAQERKFAEDYPDIWKQMQVDRDEARKLRADAFADSVEYFTKIEGDKTVKTEFGLSALALNQLREAHMSFATGKASLEVFENAIRSVMSGMVEYGERGSNREKELQDIPQANTAEGMIQVKRQFADKVAEIQLADSVDRRAATKLAAERYPDLYNAYRQATPVVH